jgi:hypothetical protein
LPWWSFSKIILAAAGLSLLDRRKLDLHAPIAGAPLASAASPQLASLRGESRCRAAVADIWLRLPRLCEILSAQTAGHSHPEVVMAIRTTRSVGMILLSAWLILYGLTSFVAIPIPPVVSAVLAILAGVLILLGM